VLLSIFFNDKLVGEVLADRFRSDLAKARIGNGGHAFEFVPPAGAFATALTIEVRAPGNRVIGSFSAPAS